MSEDIVPDIWKVRDTLDDHIRKYRYQRDRGRGTAMTYAPQRIAALQALRSDLFGEILDITPSESSGQ